MQGKRLWKGTSSQGADGSWLQKAEGSAGPDQTFYPKMLQPLEGFQLHPRGTRSPGAKGQMGNITVGSSPLSPQHQGVPAGSARAGIFCWEEDWRWGMGDTVCLLLWVTMRGPCPLQ